MVSIIPVILLCLLILGFLISIPVFIVSLVRSNRNRDTEEKLCNLNELLAKGIITQEEYNAERKEIIKDM